MERNCRHFSASLFLADWRNWLFVWDFFFSLSGDLTRSEIFLGFKSRACSKVPPRDLLEVSRDTFCVNRPRGMALVLGLEADGTCGGITFFELLL